MLWVQSEAGGFQFGDQWRRPRSATDAPPANTPGVDRLPHLTATRGAHDAVLIIKPFAGRVVGSSRKSSTRLSVASKSSTQSLIGSVNDGSGGTARQYCINRRWRPMSPTQVAEVVRRNGW